MHCCGIYGPNDWEPVTHDKLPTSCCQAFPVNGFCTEVDAYKSGCYKQLKNYLEENSELVIWTAIGFALLQVRKRDIMICENYNQIQLTPNVNFVLFNVFY